MNSALLLIALLLIPWAVVSSYSMEPTLEVGDLVIMINPPNDCTHLISNIAIYQSSNELIIHRIIEASATSPSSCILIFKGDANPSADPYPVNLGEVVGLVIFDIPYIGLLSLIYHKAEAALFIVTLAVIMGISAHVADGPREN